MRGGAWSERGDFVLDDKQNVTFKAFFKFSTLMLTGTMLYVTTITPTVYGRNCIIVSLFLMLSMAFAYVIILYIAYGRLSLHEPKSAKKQKNVIIALIYEGRMAAKAGILTFIVAEAARGLVLRRYGGIAVAVPVLLAAVSALRLMRETLSNTMVSPGCTQCSSLSSSCRPRQAVPV